MHGFHVTPIGRSLATLGVAAALGLTAAPALAQTPAPATSAQAAAGTMAPHGARLTIRDAYDRVEAAGYRHIREIEWDDGRYEVKAQDAQGARVKLYLDGDTGAIEGQRRRD